ncbi:MAG: VOC family protein [Pseudomonadota bacterium]
MPPAEGAIPYLVVKGAADAIAFYQRVFDAQVSGRLDAPDGVLHAELKVGPARFMLTEERPERGALGPLALGGSATHAVLYVPDADATVARAVAAGAKVGMPVADQFWGDRSGTITDPFGHQWFVSTHQEDLTNEQIEQRLRAMMAQSGPACG